MRSIKKQLPGLLPTPTEEASSCSCVKVQFLYVDKTSAEAEVFGAALMCIKNITDMQTFIHINIQTIKFITEVPLASGTSAKTGGEGQ